MISVTYVSKNENVPKLEDVFGTDIVAESRTDRMIYKLLSIPEAG